MRFETPELPEITVGRLSDADFWSEFHQSRLPVADIPQPIRDLDPALRYQPVIELSRNDGLRAAKIGGKVLSYHVTQTYPGWDIFRSEVADVVAHIVNKMRRLQFIRLGLRYINVFVPEKHGAVAIEDTNLTIKLGQTSLRSPVNLNYSKNIDGSTVGVRIATPGFVGGPLPPNFSLLCDIDVYTAEGFSTSDIDLVLRWIDRAHEVEKLEFFRLLPPKIVSRLTAAEQRRS